MPKISKEEKKQVIDELWRRGQLSWLLDSSQKELYNLYYNTEHKTQTWLLSRRSGKSFALVCLAIEHGIRKKNSIVKFLAPTKLQLTNIVRPLFRKVLESCPQELQPEFKQKDNIYYFPNGSEIHLAGTDGGHAEKLRGGDSDANFIDEAGSCKDLDYIVKSILLPTTLMTKGKTVLASTPPEESDHDFIKFIEDSELRGSLIKKTVYDNPRLAKKDIDELIEELGGIHTDACRRELFCELIRSVKTCVLPEFTEELQKSIVKEWPMPPFFDSYVAMDLGGKDLTAVLFGYYDFRADKIIIQDELIMDFRHKENNIETLTQKISNIEEKLWTNSLTNEKRKPYIRVSDINYIVTQEILKYSNSQISFVSAKKDDKETAINNLRILLANKKIIIDPKCQTLIRHLKNVKWSGNSNKSDFARSPDDGHYDAVDACVYLVRHVVFSKNPYPANYNVNMRDIFINNPKSMNNNNTQLYKSIFNIKPRSNYGK